MTRRRFAVVALLLGAGCRPPPAPALEPVADAAIVHGCVRDDRGYAVAGALVRIEPLDAGARTGETGCYVLRSRRFGAGEIGVVLIGHHPTRRPVVLRAGTVLRHDVRMRRVPIILSH